MRSFRENSEEISTKKNREKKMFSGTVKLTDLDDYISPAQDCAMMAETKKDQDDIKKKNFEMHEEKNKKSVKINFEDDTSVVTIKRPNLIKQKKGEKKATVNLYDCLACSGCVTSSEVVLMEEQGLESFKKILSEAESSIIFMAPQSRVALAKKFEMSEVDLMARLSILLENKFKVMKLIDLQFFINLAVGLAYKEFKSKTEEVEQGEFSLPLICSECPGWICYLEKVQGKKIVPFSARVKPPQLISGQYLKRMMKKIGIEGEGHVVGMIQPCFDKKLETFRPESFVDGHKGVDIVLSTNELASLIEENKNSFEEIQIDKENFKQSWDFENILIDFMDATPGSLDELKLCGLRGLDGFKFKCNSYEKFGTSNNYLNQILLKYATELNPDGEFVESMIKNKKRRNDNFIEVTLEVRDGLKLKGARVYGFKNIQNLIRKIKSSKCKYNYVELMACPSGCLSGGGQIQYDGVKPKDTSQELKEIYHSGDKIKEMFFENETVNALADAISSGEDEFYQWADVEYKVKELEGVSNPAAIKW